MRLVFMGSPELAVPSLGAASQLGDLAGVVTQPPRGKGRGRKVTPSAVALECERMGIEPTTPDNIRTPEFSAWLRDLRPDLVIVVAYGKILPPSILETPRLGCVNVHTSLLPELRGAAPIQWAIARGAVETGVTLMKMDEGMDTGPILLQTKTAVGQEETAGKLAGRLSLMASDILMEGVPLYARGELAPVPQDDSRATCAPLLKKEDGRIDWTMGAREIANRVRGFTPWPGTYSELAGKRVHIISALALTFPLGGEPGEVLKGENGQIDVACGKGVLRILSLKPEGKREMSPAEYLAGYRLGPGDRFGE